MILLLVLIVLTTVSIVLHFSLDDFDDFWLGASIFLGIVLCLVVIVLPVARYDSYLNTIRFDEAQRTLEVARNNDSISDMELAAIQTEIIKQNMWLVEARKWKGNVFVGMYAHPRVLELEPIK